MTQLTCSLSQSLNNQNVYSGCCTLRLSDTKMKDLDVKSNSDKARDYTKEPPQYMRSTPRLDNIPIFSESGVRTVGRVILLSVGGGYILS